MRKAYENYVKEIRNNMPSYNHGRCVVILSEYTVKGKGILGRASHWVGNDLHQVYDKWSDAKQRAYDEAWEMYCNDEKAEDFSICSANTHQFTVSWVTPVDVVFLTANYEYHVICDNPLIYA